MNTTTVDGRGRPVHVFESYFDHFFHQLNTYYDYGPFDSIYRVTDPAGNVLIREVNRLGILWHSQDCDRHFTYNAFGGVETETTPEYSETYHYDVVGRPQTAVVGTRTTTFFWDATPLIARAGSLVDRRSGPRG